MNSLKTSNQIHRLQSSNSLFSVILYMLISLLSVFAVIVVLDLILNLITGKIRAITMPLLEFLLFVGIIIMLLVLKRRRTDYIIVDRESIHVSKASNKKTYHWNGISFLSFELRVRNLATGMFLIKDSGEAELKFHLRSRDGIKQNIVINHVNSYAVYKTIEFIREITNSDPKVDSNEEIKLKEYHFIF